jgi:predicted Fe-S protein YdhL (DUF1289 family)
MKTINCKFCKREVPFDSLLCPYCGRRFNEVQSFIEAQKEKRRKIMELNDVKRKLMMNTFKPIELKISNIGRSKYSHEGVMKGSKPKLVIYILIFFMFITLIAVVMIAFG